MTFGADVVIAFTGSGTDDEDGDLTGQSLAWGARTTGSRSYAQVGSGTTPTLHQRPRQRSLVTVHEVGLGRTVPEPTPRNALHFTVGT